MRTQPFRAAAGVSLRAISMPGDQIRGIEIDNSSGSWLFIPTLEEWVPPYTIGWSFGTPYGLSAIDVLAQNGPAGQVSTSQGDGITVVLSDSIGQISGGGPDPAAPGFIQAFTPTQTVNAGFNSAFGNAVFATLLPAVAGKRYRIFSATYQHLEDILTPLDSRATLLLQSGSTAPLQIFMEITPSAPIDRAVFSGGIDCPTGFLVQYLGTGEWASVQTRVTVTYQQI